MNKAKVGDKVRLVNKPLWVGEYEDGDTGVVVDRDSWGNACAREDHVLVLLDKGWNQVYTVHENEIQVVNTKCAFTNLKPSAEEVRENILSLRIERERLNVAISDIDKQEAEALSRVLDSGWFVLHEIRVKPSEKKVLYAEDIEEDMTDRRNWKVGDVFVCTDWNNPETYLTGDVCHMVGIEDDIWPILKSCRSGHSNGIALTERFKFLYRPVNN